jgi:hypothetical protein
LARCRQIIPVITFLWNIGLTSSGEGLGSCEGAKNL